MDMESIDICITFDTTGSMYPCLTQVRRSIREMVNRLFRDIADLRIAIIAHGDYCDAGHTYVTKMMDFSTDPNEIISFVESVGPTHGGDAPECYELALHEARTKLSWQSGRSKVITMIGDSVPHGPTYALNTKNIDWRNELGLLLEAGINVYGVHAMPGIRSYSKPFYEEIANKTGGYYLTLEQFKSITDLIMAVCYKQSGEEELKAFAEELKEKGRLTREVASYVRKMGGVEVEEFAYAGGLVPVPAGRFQVLRVDEDQPIKEFVQENGITFKKGRGFYQLTETEKVGTYKEIILVDKKTGDIFSGPEVREMLSLSPQTASKGTSEKLRPVFLEKYDVFIQSTSTNRKLDRGTNLLYEVEDWDRADIA